MAVYQGTRVRPATRTVRLPALRLPTLTSVRVVVLILGGMALLTAAAWMVAVAFGLAVAGVSCWLVNWLSSGPTLGSVAADLQKLARDAHPADRAAIQQAAAAIERIGQQP